MSYEACILAVKSALPEKIEIILLLQDRHVLKNAVPNKHLVLVPDGYRGQRGRSMNRSEIWLHFSFPPI